MTKSVPKLEFLFSPGCGAMQATVAMINKTVGELDLPVEVSEIVVETVEKARKLKFLGSPSIRVNGHDIEPGAEQRQDFGMG
jgi:hypothetical protein